MAFTNSSCGVGYLCSSICFIASAYSAAELVPQIRNAGFFITEDEFPVPSEHVVRDATQVRLVTSAGLISARVVKVDAANDLALLKAEGRFASWSSSFSLSVW